jgi:hypothetical protein
MELLSFFSMMLQVTMTRNTLDPVYYRLRILFYFILYLFFAAIGLFFRKGRAAEPAAFFSFFSFFLFLSFFSCPILRRGYASSRMRCILFFLYKFELLLPEFLGFATPSRPPGRC